MVVKKEKNIVPIIFFIVLFGMPAYPQKDAKDNKPAADDYVSLYNSGAYKKTLGIIEKKLNEIYSKRVDVKRVPSEFIIVKKDEKEKKKEYLKTLFRSRKNESFFIEDNQELSALHLFAARSNFKLNKYDHSLNHYMQCLRFRTLEYKRDDQVLYEMAQVYKSINDFQAYINALEAAGTLNPENEKYSLEIGSALYNTARKKEAISYLEKYIAADEGKIDPKIYLMLGNLYEDTSKYLETEKNYIKYLAKKPDDGYIHFALGYVAYSHTGNYLLALRSLDRALELLPDGEIFRRSKAHEYKGDIARANLDYKSAISSYAETIVYQDKIREKMDKKKSEIGELKKKINDLKTSLLTKQDYDQYEEYEMLKDEKGKKELELETIENEYRILNPGKSRWSIAFCHEQGENLDEAIKFYRQSIEFNYNPNEAREKIIKLQLKIKRGY